MRSSMLTVVMFATLCVLSSGCHKQAAPEGASGPPASAETQETAKQFVGNADMPPAEKAAIQAQMQKKSAESAAH